MTLIVSNVVVSETAAVAATAAAAAVGCTPFHSFRLVWSQIFSSMSFECHYLYEIDVHLFLQLVLAVVPYYCRVHGMVSVRISLTLCSVWAMLQSQCVYKWKERTFVTHNMTFTVSFHDVTKRNGLATAIVSLSICNRQISSSIIRLHSIISIALPYADLRQLENGMECVESRQIAALNTGRLWRNSIPNGDSIIASEALYFGHIEISQFSHQLCSLYNCVTYSSSLCSNSNCRNWFEYLEPFLNVFFQIFSLFSPSFPPSFCLSNRRLKKQNKKKLKMKNCWWDEMRFI